ncbi:hypothetical protein [Streptomyces sp. NPDC088196]|uniref:hypothetical protein n=1 Tax=Streptomyces sp. NPDC088196 TaxID=3154868 RepID=UPI003451093D
MTGSGRSLSAVARELGPNRRTVAKYDRATTWHECVRRTPPRRTTSLDPYLEYLQQRWDEGEQTAAVLHQEIIAKGYCGHYQRVKMAIAPLRRGLPIDTPRERPPSPREVARWITTTPSHRSLHATEALGRLHKHCPELNRTHDLVRRFADSPPCSTPVTPPCCRTGSTASPPRNSPPWPAWPSSPRGPARSRTGHHNHVQLRRERRPYL